MVFPKYDGAQGHMAILGNTYERSSSSPEFLGDSSRGVQVAKPLGKSSFRYFVLSIKENFP
jgi:hypothetical protein